MALFLSFVAWAVVSTVQVQGQAEVDNCLDTNTNGDGAWKCLNYDGIIACLKNALSSADSDPELSLEIETHVNYYGAERKFTSCPRLDNNGTCLQREIQNCLPPESTAAFECSKPEAHLQCLIDLKGACGGHVLLEHWIQLFTERVRDCQLSKPGTPAEKCVKKVKDCIQDFQNTLEEGTFEEDACGNLGSSLACLNAIEAKCDQYIGRVKGEFNVYVSACRSH